MPNSPKLSIELARLFPPGVTAAEVTGIVERSLLTSSELQSIAHCADKRIQDFTAGRACAHRVLAELGISGFSLLSGAQREPLWPTSIVGSITHTHGYAAAVVARSRDVRSLGLDCEVVDSLDEDLWSRICTPAELERLNRLPPGQQRGQAALIFAAKEAFYKCQFPLTRAWVGFEDVLIEPLDWPATRGTLRIVPQSRLPLDDANLGMLVCRFELRDAWVLAGVGLPVK